MRDTRNPTHPPIPMFASFGSSLRPPRYHIVGTKSGDKLHMLCDYRDLRTQALAMNERPRASELCPYCVRREAKTDA